jgi:hypothetical protein
MRHVLAWLAARAWQLTLPKIAKDWSCHDVPMLLAALIFPCHYIRMLRWVQLHHGGTAMPFTAQIKGSRLIGRYGEYAVIRQSSHN